MECVLDFDDGVWVMWMMSEEEEKFVLEFIVVEFDVESVCVCVCWVGEGVWSCNVGGRVSSGVGEREWEWVER